MKNLFQKVTLIISLILVISLMVPLFSSNMPSASATPATIFKIQSGLVTSDSLITGDVSDWANNGSAVDPTINATHSNYEDSNGYHIGILAPTAGKWAGWFAITPLTSATLFHATIKLPDAKPITGVLDTAIYVQQEMFQDPRIDAMGCGADILPTQTHWSVSLQAGDKDNEIVNQSIYSDDSPNQPTTRECTLVTNGSNQLTAYIDGQKVFSSNKMNLNMPKPFQYYLELQTNSNDPSIGSNFTGTFTDYYATTSENVKVRNAGVGSIVRIVNATSGGTLASSTAGSDGIALVDVGRYHMPINANVQVYDSSGVNLLATTSSSPGIYGGDVYDVGTSTVPATVITIKAADMNDVNAVPHLYTTITNGTAQTHNYTTTTFHGFQDRPYIVEVSNYGSLIFDHWDDGSKISGRIITSTASAVNVTAYFRDSTLPDPPESLTSTTQYTTKVVTPTILGTATPGYSVQLSDGANPIANPVTVKPNGTWSITTPTLSTGNHIFSATSTFGLDISPNSTPLTMTIDTITPLVHISGNTLLNRQVTLTGTSLDNDSGIKIVEVSVDNSPTFTKVKTNVTADWSAWSFTTGQLTVGSHHFIVRATDMALNQNTNATDILVTVDTTPPLAPLITNSSLSTNTHTPKIVGTAEANSIVKLFNGTTQIGSSNATGGTWSITSAFLSNGAHVIRANATDAANNTSPNSGSITITVDTTPPLAPLITNSSLSTNTHTPKIVGTAEANSIVKLFNGTTQIGSSNATGGTWSITSAFLSNGAHVIRANATDAANNTSPNSGSITVTVDTTPLILLNPSSGNVSSTVNISGINFVPSSIISIKFNGVTQTTNPTTITTNSTGGFTGSITVPASNTGQFPISATDALSNIASSQFTVAYFKDTTIVSGLDNPTAMELAPDGRIFISEQTGKLRVVLQNGTLLATPFLTVPVNSIDERGLLGIAFDPNFNSNRYVYVYYTSPSPTIHNVVSRFTANSSNPNVALPNTKFDILSLETLGPTNHNGGTIHFGPDGKLYVAVGNNAINSNSPSLSTHLGKILRINSDGTIPLNNPFFNTPGAVKEIWAYGLRNPFTFVFQPVTGKMYINDVGEDTWEEIDNGTAGANYGWPTCEGPKLLGSSTDCNISGLTNPIYFYNHNGSSSAIAGAAFYEATQFPAEYKDNYFFGDYTDTFPFGFIGRLLPTNPPQAVKFLNASSPVDIKVGPDGSLYYLDWGSGSNDGELHKVQYIKGFVDCVSPTSGDWTITTSCTLSSNTIIHGNVIVQNNAVLTIPSGVSLDIDFATKHLLVKSGSGILVKSGGKIF